MQDIECSLDYLIAHKFHGKDYYKAAPDRLHLHTGHKSLGLWYITDDIIVGVYPLGFLYVFWKQYYFNMIAYLYA